MNEKNFNYQIEQLGQRISNVNEEIQRLKQKAENVSLKVKLQETMDNFSSITVAQYFNDKETYKKFNVTPNVARLVDELNTQGDLYRQYVNNLPSAEGFCLFINES